MKINVWKNSWWQNIVICALVCSNTPQSQQETLIISHLNTTPEPDAAHFSWSNSSFHLYQRILIIKGKFLDFHSLNTIQSNINGNRHPWPMTDS